VRTLEETIIKLVDSKSGGMKFVELIAELVSLGLKGDIDEPEANIMNPNFIENKIRIMPKLGILEYVWHNRIKMFVYMKD